MTTNPFAPHLLIEDRGPVKVVTINHPERRNSIDEELHQALSELWRFLAADPETRAVVLTGAGKAFSAGGDMSMMEGMWNDLPHRRRMLDVSRRIVREQVAFPIPTIAAVNGPAVGLGCSLAVMSDIVYMSETAYFSDPHVAVGLTSADGGSVVWPLLTSLLRAKEYLFTGERISAAQAVSFGMANRALPAEAVLPEALALAERIAAMPAQAIQTTKRAVNKHLSRAVEDVIDYAFAAEHDSFDAPEHRAIIQSFMAKS